MCFKSSPSPVSQAPAPVAAPPVTERQSEVVAAKRQTRSDAARRKGLFASMLAGETGGYQSPTGGKSLLGQ